MDNRVMKALGAIHQREDRLKDLRRRADMLVVAVLEGDKDAEKKWKEIRKQIHELEDES